MTNVKKNKTVAKVRFDDQLKSYQLKIGSLRFESESSTQFSIRKNELQRINLKQIPMKVKFILHDETLNKNPELVNIKIIFEKIGELDYALRIEESSKADRWNDNSLMLEYFGRRKQMLVQRQVNYFDLIVESTYDDEDCFFIQYTIQISNVQTEQILKIVKVVLAAVHSSAKHINNSIAGDENSPSDNPDYQS